jgi:uncharacterized membrane protein YeaQ/YmgE (transglycosylase-associated protein family)
MALSLFEFLIVLLIAGIWGALAQAIAGFSRGGCLSAIVMGFIGALLSSYDDRLPVRYF